MVSFGVILAASFAALCASQPPGTPPPGTPPPGITPPPGVTLPPMPPASSTDYADEFPDECYVDWPDVDTCVQEDIYEDSSTRLLRSNAVPPYFVNLYCPFGINMGNCSDVYECGYCAEGETNCMFDDICDYPGDPLVPQYSYWSAPLYPDPTASDVPRAMYYVQDGYSTNFQASVGFSLSGISMQGPTEAGGINVDEAGIVFACGGHVTPPVGGGSYYHYHKAPECNESVYISGEHGHLFGYALDGFGIYGFWDVDGDKPVVDECGGHFGAVPPNNEIVYHYHAATSVPYYVSCQGPALGKCHEVQTGTFDACGTGCGTEVCVQPGTDETALETYLDQYNSSWLESYSVNDYKTMSASDTIKYAKSLPRKQVQSFVPLPFPEHVLVTGRIIN